MAEIKLKIASVVIGSGEGGGSGVAPCYADLPDKPSINGKTLSGNKTTKDLGLASSEQVVPSGGTTGQVLTKKSNLPNDVEWAPSSGVIGANAKNLDAGSNATASIDEDHILQLGIPVGQDAVNPFKGIYGINNKPTGTFTIGDYLYAPTSESGQTGNTIWKWNCTDWQDSGETPDLANGETFASSETLQEVAIDDSHLVNPVNTADSTQPVLAQADDVMQLKAKLDGVTASETKVNAVVGTNVTTGAYVSGETGLLVTPGSSTSSYSYFELAITQGTKSIRFATGTKTSSAKIGYSIGHYEENVYVPTRMFYFDVAETTPPT
ncbi:MAG: hypothetical protein IIT85_05220, partial [Prevotella sp.]|nr:hypothetical protein [Prevotella sp.]